MAEKLSQIFGFRKTTFSAPSSESDAPYEQDTLFVQVEQARSRAGNGMFTAKIMGTLIVFTQMDKMPFGYFNRRIEQAHPSLTKDFLFFDIDLNPISTPAKIQNISERRVRFVYLYKAQYDPEQGELTSLEI